MMKPVVLLDVDGVLSDFVGGVVRAAKTYGHAPITPITTWDVFSHFDPPIGRVMKSLDVKGQGFCRDLEPLPGAIEAVRHLRKISDVYAVTTPWDSLYWVHERTRWLHEHFGLPFAKQVHTAAKHLVSGDVFVDDKPSNVTAWIENQEGDCFLWGTDQNRGQLEHFRTTNWDAVVYAAENYKP
jgi:5'(3')-deoxyribonucleotidase